MSLFKKGVACGCAVEGGEVFFVALRYAAAARRVEISDARFGRETDAYFIRKLCREYGKSPLWVPVRAETVAQLSDVRIIRIDDGDGKIRGSELDEAVTTQLRGVEAALKGDYVRTKASITLGGRPRWIGGSIPRQTVEDTFSLWREMGFSKPCVASRHVAIANLYLALHPGAGSQTGRTILSCWQNDMDIFCFMDGGEFVDCGSSVSSPEGGFDQHIGFLNEWAEEFMNKHPSEGDVALRAVVISHGEVAKPEDFTPGESLFFWSVPWGESVTFGNEAVKSAVEAHPEMAMRAIGLALHGV